MDVTTAAAVETPEVVATPEAQQPEGQTTGTTSQATTQPGNAPATATPQEVSDWLKDKRADTMWKKDPNNMYKSYREMEKLYEPTKKQLEQLNALFTEYKIKPEQIKDIMTELNTLKSPDQPQNALFNGLKPYLSDPVYSKEIEAFFTDLERKALVAKYPGMSEDAIRKQIEIETELKTIKAEQQQRNNKEFEANLTKEMNGAWSGLEELAKSSGLEMTPEIKNKFIEACSKEEIPPKLWKAYFRDLFSKEIDSAYESIKEKQVIDKLNKNKSATLPGGATKTQAAPAKSSFKEKLTKIVTGNAGGVA